MLLLLLTNDVRKHIHQVLLIILVVESHLGSDVDLLLATSLLDLLWWLWLLWHKWLLVCHHPLKPLIFELLLLPGCKQGHCLLADQLLVGKLHLGGSWLQQLLLLLLLLLLLPGQWNEEFIQVDQNILVLRLLLLLFCCCCCWGGMMSCSCC